MIVVIFALIYAVLIFPLFLNVKIIFNYEHKKAYYNIELFGLIKILSGYIQLSVNKLLIHVSDTKAIIIELIDIDGVKKSFKPFMDYHFITVNSKLELGSKENSIKPLTISFILNYVQSIIKWILLNKKPYLKINNCFNVYEEQDVFTLFSKTLIVFNLLMVIISFVKIILEKIVYEFRQIRQQN